MASARAAFIGWSLTSLDDRKALLLRYRDRLTARADELAELISREVGKPLWESRGEVATMISKVAISIDAFEKRTGTHFISTSATGATELTHRPHGVMVVLAPFNFPGHLANGHFVPALLAGNTIVLKPSEFTPLVGQFFGDVMAECGVPDGVFNVVIGGGGVGQQIANHPELDGLCFTGSSSTGRQLASVFGRMPEKILALEMGGNNPFILHSAADPVAAAAVIAQAAFLTSGQRCTCTRRLIVVSSENTDSVLGELIRLADSVTVGPYYSRPEPFMGTVISQNAALHLQSVADGLVKRGGVVLGQQRKPQGAFFFPTIIDVSQVSHLADKEIFGPLLQVIRANRLDDAIREANNTRFGLSASVMSIGRDTFEYCFGRIRAGIINWNTPTTGSSSQAPFGGIGWSGNHRPTALYAADYCAYPVVSTQAEAPAMPAAIPGFPLHA